MLVTRASSSPNSPHPDTGSVADLLISAAQHQPTCGLHFASTIHDAEFMPYPALLDEARRIAHGLRSRAGDRGSKICLLLEDPRDFIPTFWGCLLSGHVPCPLARIRSDAERWKQHLAHVDGLLERPLFVSTDDLMSDLPGSVKSISLDELRAEAPEQQLAHRAQPSDAAILMLTSGSTGNSKAVELTHRNLLTSLAGRAKRQQLTHEDVMFNWIAFDHVAALLESHMIAQYVGASQLHVEPAVVLADPLQFLRLIHRHRVSVAFAPNFLLGQINAALESTKPTGSEGRALALDLSCLRRIVTGGEANVVNTGRRFLELLAPYGLKGNALWPAFGMTETCAASVYSHDFPERDKNSEFAAVGLPIDGMEIRILNQRGARVAEGETGELQLRGPLIFERYYNNQEATRSAFTQDGWFRTGDLGRVVDGRLSLVARSKDSIIVNGVNYYSHELEAELERLDGVQLSFVAAFPTRPQGADTEQLVVTFSTAFSADDDDRMYQLISAVRNTTIMLWGFRPTAILPLPQEAFPKTSLGKIQRSLMRKRFEAGELALVLEQVKALATRQLGAHVSPEGSTEIALAEIFAKTLGCDVASVSATANFFDLGGTSLDILKLTHALEQRFGFHANVSTILQTPTVRQLAARVSARGAQSATTYDPIVPLQVTGRKTPLFCVHPGNGEILVLVNLAKYFMNDRPFYALRARGFNPGEECFQSMEEIVQTYLNAILKIQPHGPYALAGYSLGFAIAFEIAKQLEARGERVEFLGCIDATPCYEPAPIAFNMVAGLAVVLGLITSEQYQKLNADLGPTPPTLESCKKALELASPRRFAELDLDLQRFSTWARVAHSLEDLVYRHATAGHVENMTVFGSDGLIAFHSKDEWSAMLNRWKEFSGSCKQVRVAGNHHTVMSPKHVANFQATLRAEIDLATGAR
jgi:acyl-CoA synthetase (AMP-forming)/AMP-acid ligase II/thioesterase domain-containing protein/acyl carrier protein